MMKDYRKYKHFRAIAMWKPRRVSKKDRSENPEDWAYEIYNPDTGEVLPGIVYGLANAKDECGKHNSLLGNEQKPTPEPPQKRKLHI